MACCMWHVTLLAGRLLLDLIEPFLGVLPKHQRVRRAARARLLLLFIRVRAPDSSRLCAMCLSVCVLRVLVCVCVRTRNSSHAPCWNGDPCRASTRQDLGCGGGFHAHYFTHLSHVAARGCVSDTIESGHEVLQPCIFECHLLLHTPSVINPQ